MSDSLGAGDDPTDPTPPRERLRPRAVLPPETLDAGHGGGYPDAGRAVVTPRGEIMREDGAAPGSVACEASADGGGSAGRVAPAAAGSDPTVPVVETSESNPPGRSRWNVVLSPLRTNLSVVDSAVDPFRRPEARGD